MIKEPSLELTEIFTSIQGETSFSGLPTTFVRLARCNLRCSWCDTSYSFTRGKSKTYNDILKEIHEGGAPHICITGGEPLLQPSVLPLMSKMCDLGYLVTIETGGSLTTKDIDSRVHVILDIKCPKSNMSEKNLWSNLAHLKRDDEVKFVIQDEEDYNFAKGVCDKYNLYKKVKEVLFSPVFNVMNTQTLVSWILRDKLKVRLNLQIHKFIWAPETIGV